jgi:outer membrane protein
LSLKFASALTAAILSLASASVLAQAKIGFVNSERILRESAPAQRADKKLEAEFSAKDKELASLGRRLQEESQKFEKDNQVLNETQRNQRQRQLQEMDRDFQRKQREFREDLNQRRNEEFSSVLQAANKVLRDIATKENFDAIFQDATYVNPKLDITDRVLKALADAK